jgi:hypothetical protein
MAAVIRLIISIDIFSGCISGIVRVNEGGRPHKQRRKHLLPIASEMIPNHMSGYFAPRPENARRARRFVMRHP